MLWLLSWSSVAVGQERASVECLQDGTRAVCAKQSADLTGRVVQFSGTGLVPDTTYRVRVVREDGTLVSGDGTGAAWPTAYDTIVTDAEGDFRFDYHTADAGGSLEVEILPASGPEVAVLGTIDTDFIGPGGGVNVIAVANPPRPTACGLDIVLVMDSSGSISSS